MSNSPGIELGIVLKSKVAIGLLAITLLGGGLRLVVMEQTFPSRLVGDEIFYARVASNIAAGHGAMKTPKDRARERQLNILIQIHGLSGLADYLSKNPNLTAETRDFDTKLVQWVRDHESMNPVVFYQSFNKLKAQVYALRTRHAAQRKAGEVE